MLRRLLYELVGLAMFAASMAMLWIARPVESGPALFLRRKERYEIGFALVILFLLAGGFGCLLLGFTT